MLRYEQQNDGGAGIILTDQVLAIMQQYRQITEEDREAGGQLFARFQGQDTIIVEATPPRPSDRRTHMRFRPNRKQQQQEINERYDRGLHFVGDWHTHPELFPRPSAEDFASMEDCYKRSIHELRAFILVIVGTAQTPGGVSVVLITKGATKTMKCTHSC